MSKRLEFISPTKKVVYLIGLTLLINFLFALLLFIIMEDRDFQGSIPKHDPLQKFLTLFYFSLTTFTTTGYGDIVPMSLRTRLLTSIFMIVIYSATILFITHYF